MLGTNVGSSFPISNSSSVILQVKHTQEFSSQLSSSPDISLWHFGGWRNERNLRSWSRQLFSIKVKGQIALLANIFANEKCHRLPIRFPTKNIMHQPPIVCLQISLSLSEVGRETSARKGDSFCLFRETNLQAMIFFVSVSASSSWFYCQISLVAL